MSVEIIIIIILIIILVGLFIWIIVGRGNKKNNSGLDLLLQQMNELARTIDNKLGESSKQRTESMRHQSTESIKMVRDITERLTRLDETNKQVISFTDQLQSLQDILKN